MKTAHTRWQADGRFIKDGKQIIAECEPTMGPIHPEMKVRGEANAEFIVRAVNAHDALVEALDGLLAFVEGPFVDAKAREAHLDFAPHRAVLAAARKEGAK